MLTECGYIYLKQFHIISHPVYKVICKQEHVCSVQGELRKDLFSYLQWTFIISLFGEGAKAHSLH